jgi:hypothetical protein
MIISQYKFTPFKKKSTYYLVGFGSFNVCLVHKNAEQKKVWMESMQFQKAFIVCMS